MDSWLQRLAVRGPADDIAAFKKATASPSKADYLYERAQFRTQRLSFVKLRSALPPSLADGIDEAQDPWDLVIDPPRRFRDGTIEITYRFQLDAFEPENLIAAASTMFPRLMYVLGTVAPSADEQSSLLAHAGKVRRWRISNRIKEPICAKIPEETEDNGDEVLWALAEADSKMMDEVMNHWKKKVDEIIVQSGNARPLKHRRSPKTRRGRISNDDRVSREGR